MWSRSGLVLFIWFFHWAAAATDRKEWSWDNLRTSLLTLLLSPSWEHFLPPVFFFLFMSKMLWFERQGWWAVCHMPHTQLRGMLRLETGVFCFLPAQSQPALGGTLSLQCLFLTPCSHSSSNKNSISFGLTPLTLLLLIGTSRKLEKLCWNYYLK